jgi:hypothetical protein
MSDPLTTLGVRRTAETAIEIATPLAVFCGAWWVAQSVLGAPTVSRELGPIELGGILGALVALLSWFVARQLSAMSVRRPWVHAAWAAGANVISIGALSTYVDLSFDGACADQGGAIVHTEPVVLASERGLELGGGDVCQLSAVPGNPYLTGTVLRPTWSGEVHPLLAGWLLLVAVGAAVGLRNVRVASTRMGLSLVDELGMAPAAGSKAVIGGADGDLQACGNATLWGEPCGQLYAADRVFEPGEWCVRCAQSFRKADRTLSFSVVSLFTADIDVLNGLERLDASSWTPGDPPPPDARLSGQERWVTLGRIEVPDVVTVATLLALIDERLKAWSQRAPDAAKPAFELAEKRASRLACWIWFGHHDHRLTYARPTDRVLLALGSTRLRDLALEAGEDLVLQLDTGLLPLELRTGFRQTFLDPSREPVVQNTRQDFWVPVTAARPRPDGLWVPRIEGDALRAWLSVDRLRPDDVRGVSSPRPYTARTAAPPKPVAEGALDLVRMGVTEEGEIDGEIGPGASIAEWAWLDQHQIELLRQQALVLVGI